MSFSDIKKLLYEFVGSPSSIEKVIALLIIVLLAILPVVERIPVILEMYSNFRLKGTKNSESLEAYKEQLVITESSKNILGIITMEDRKTLELYRKAAYWYTEVIENTPFSRGQKALLTMDYRRAAVEVLPATDVTEVAGKVANIPYFYKSIYLIFPILGLLFRLVFALPSIALLFNGVFAIHEFIYSWLFVFYSLILIFIGEIVYTSINSLGFTMSGSVQAEIFYRAIAHKNSRKLVDVNKVTRSNRIKASCTDEMIPKYIKSPISSRKILSLVNLERIVPAMNPFLWAIVCSTDYGCTKNEIDEGSVTSNIEMNHIKSLLVNVIVWILKVQDFETSGDS